MFNKQLVRQTSSILLASLLFGCATTYHGDGIVISEHKINETTPQHKLIKKGAITGGVIGAVPGVSMGALIGGVAGLLLPGGIPTIIIGSAIGGVAGGLTLGFAGAAVGGGIGCLVEKTHSNFANYQYSVKSLNDSKIITVSQYSVPVPVNTRVKIIERNGNYFIKKH